eukprot:gene5994-5285_t
MASILDSIDDFSTQEATNAEEGGEKPPELVLDEFSFLPVPVEDGGWSSVPTPRSSATLNQEFLTPEYTSSRPGTAASVLSRGGLSKSNASSRPDSGSLASNSRPASSSGHTSNSGRTFNRHSLSLPHTIVATKLRLGSARQPAVEPGQARNTTRRASQGFDFQVSNQSPGTFDWGSQDDYGLMGRAHLNPAPATSPPDGPVPGLEATLGPTVAKQLFPERSYGPEPGLEATLGPTVAKQLFPEPSDGPEPGLEATLGPTVAKQLFPDPSAGQGSSSQPVIMSSDWTTLPAPSFSAAGVVAGAEDADSASPSCSQLADPQPPFDPSTTQPAGCRQRSTSEFSLSPHPNAGPAWGTSEDSSFMLLHSSLSVSQISSPIGLTPPALWGLSNSFKRTESALSASSPTPLSSAQERRLELGARPLSMSSHGSLSQAAKPRSTSPLHTSSSQLTSFPRRTSSTQPPSGMSTPIEGLAGSVFEKFEQDHHLMDEQKLFKQQEADLKEQQEQQRYLDHMESVRQQGLNKQKDLAKERQAHFEHMRILGFVQSLPPEEMEKAEFQHYVQYLQNEEGANEDVRRRIYLHLAAAQGHHGGSHVVDPLCDPANAMLFLHNSTRGMGEYFKTKQDQHHQAVARFSRNIEESKATEHLSTSAAQHQRAGSFKKGVAPRIFSGPAEESLRASTHGKGSPKGKPSLQLSVSCWFQEWRAMSYDMLYDKFPVDQQKRLFVL